MKNFTHVIWDWNGTLYNDVEWCIARINIMLEKRGLPMLKSVDEYQRVFGFPVKDYYKRVGFEFEKESFEILAAEFIELYNDNGNKLSLFPETKEILAEFQKNKVHQIILSATELGNLKKQMQPFNIDNYFDEVLGISNIFATSKIELGKSYIRRAMPSKAILIGDTAHDKEVADALGIDCILIASGHQSKQTLISLGTSLVNCLSDIKSIIL